MSDYFEILLECFGTDDLTWIDKNFEAVFLGEIETPMPIAEVGFLHRRGAWHDYGGKGILFANNYYVHKLGYFLTNICPHKTHKSFMEAVDEDGVTIWTGVETTKMLMKYERTWVIGLFLNLFRRDGIRVECS